MARPCIILLLVIVSTVIHGQGHSLVINGGFEIEDSVFTSSGVRNLNDQALILDHDLLPGWRVYDDNEPAYRTIELAYNNNGASSQEPSRTVHSGRTSLYFVTGTSQDGGHGSPVMVTGELQKPLVRGSMYTISMDILPFGNSAHDSIFSGVDVWFFQDTLELFRQTEAWLHPTLGDPREVHYSPEEEIGLLVGDGQMPPGQWNHVSMRFYALKPYTMFTLGMRGRTAVRSQLPAQACLIDNFSIEPVVKEELNEVRPRRSGRRR